MEITADVRDGEEALEVLDREKIDLVVTDIAMPLMDKGSNRSGKSEKISRHLCDCT